MINTDLYGDTPEQIQRCLNCPFPKCVDCASRISQAVDRIVTANPRRPKTKVEQIVFDYYIQGYFDTDISKLSGLNINTVRKTRMKMGYPILPRTDSQEDRKALVAKWA